MINVIEDGKVIGGGDIENCELSIDSCRGERGEFVDGRNGCS